MDAFLEFLPWQKDIASRWLSRRGRFAHAWLLHGVAGIGKRHFALAAAASLLCENPAHGQACRVCQACQWFSKGNHPDIRRIRPDAVAHEEGSPESLQESETASSKKNPSRDIRVDQLRELNTWFNTATHRGGWRVAVLYPAQALNIISANSLLKILEEPPRNTVFLIVADAPDRLLPTLLSRCQRLPLPVPPMHESVKWLSDQGVADPQDWLAAASQAPLRAYEHATSGAKACPDWLGDVLRLAMLQERNPDIGLIADGLEKQSSDAWIDALQRLFVDLVLARNGLETRYFPSLTATYTVAQQASLQQLADTAKWLNAQRAVANHPLSPKLFIHSILQRAVQSCQPVA